MADNDKQYQEDLEKAQALSLESLALEEFKTKRLKELHKISRTAKEVSHVLPNTETAKLKQEHITKKPRPRAGTSIGNVSSSLIAPPPSSLKKNNTSRASDTPDLISFSSPPASADDILGLCEQQSTNKLVASYPTTPNSVTYHVPLSTNPVNISRNFTSLTQHEWYKQNNQISKENFNLGAKFVSSHMHSVSSVSHGMQNFFPLSNNATYTTQAPSVLPHISLKNYHTSSIPSRPSLKSKTTFTDNQNLIDLAHTNDKNSVRVSILEEFDPILSDSSYNSTLRTISPGTEYQDDVSVCGSVYDEYDPYDFIHTGSGSNSVSDPVYAAVIKSECTQTTVLPKAHLSSMERRNIQNNQVEWHLLENISKSNDRLSGEAKDADLKAFYKMVYNIRCRFRYNDPDTNMGLVISPMVNYRYRESLSIKLCVHPDFPGADFNTPVIFTCDVNTSVEHVTLQLIYELDAPSDMYTLKVWGFNEYFVPASFLSDYEYVHNCIKLDEDVLLILVQDSQVDKSFARTSYDDKRDEELSFDDVIPNDLISHISYDDLRILLETVESEMKKLEVAAMQVDKNINSSVMPSLHPQRVFQSVKCVINLMGCLYTLDIMEALQSLEQACMEFKQSLDINFYQLMCSNCNRVRFAIHNLIEMYSRAFTVDFEVINTFTPSTTKYVPDVNDSVVVRVCAVYRPSLEWKYDSYFVVTQIYHGMRPVGKALFTQPQKMIDDPQWPSRIIFDHWFEFDDVPINSLARESRLVFVVYGRTVENLENEDNLNKPRYSQEEIGWASVQFFSYEGNMSQGCMLLSIWPKESNYLYGPAPTSGTYPFTDQAMIGVEVTAPTKIEFPAVPSDLNSSIIKADFKSLDKQTQELLEDVCHYDMLRKVVPEVREVLWEKRHYLYGIPEALPKVLLAAHSWAYSSLLDLHGMLQIWAPLKPFQAFQLLLPMFPDMQVRKVAIKWIGRLSNDELIDYLPQLVVALRHETYESSVLAQFLLDEALKYPRFAHRLFWLLSHNLPGSSPQNCTRDTNCKDDMNFSEIRHHKRMKLMLRALLATCGESLRACFLSQQLLVKDLNEAAEKVQKCKESNRQSIFEECMQQVNNNLNENPTSLPLSPTLRVVGIQVQSCFYFPSNTLPLKINFLLKNGVQIPALYKIGDDLQQDMLTLQMVRLMDKLWLKNGLDLKMVVFCCVPTGKKKGMIEIIPKAETLRKIHGEHGLTGSFQDKPIAEWLAKHNPSELEYTRAVENFTVSCAGYCVATYILGVCDRHNDNIMLKTSGHMFHIDFGKFLGDAQMFGNFKRDRAPFVLTSDMAYVINGGDRPTEKFHQFVDLCCQAFNIVRNNGNLFLCLFTLMASSGISGVNSNSVSYLHEALLPGMSNPEAAAHFAKLIQSSLKSLFTPFNFFLHNLAQLKFSGDNNDGSLLSFVPKTYSMATDGRLVHVEVVNYKKRYDPHKYYVYILRVSRENQNPNQSMEIQRTFKEFCELHEKLCILYPLAKLYSLPNGLHMGRSNIKQVAQKRFYEVSRFIKSLFLCATEIAHSDLVYTFFHPLLRDQEYETDFSTRHKDKPHPQGEIGRLKGQIKLSLQFDKGVFTVMVHHVRGLPKLPSGQEPSTYVKVYLQPDISKSTKRKTKVVKKNCYPSFMEMLEYRMPEDTVIQRTLKATVWNYDVLQENQFMGGVEIDLSEINLKSEITEWYSLVNLSR